MGKRHETSILEAGDQRSRSRDAEFGFGGLAEA